MVHVAGRGRARARAPTESHGRLLYHRAKRSVVKAARCNQRKKRKGLHCSTEMRWGRVDWSLVSGNVGGAGNGAPVNGTFLTWKRDF